MEPFHSSNADMKSKVSAGEMNTYYQQEWVMARLYAEGHRRSRRDNMSNSLASSVSFWVPSTELLFFLYSTAYVIIFARSYPSLDADEMEGGSPHFLAIFVLN